MGTCQSVEEPASGRRGLKTGRTAERVSEGRWNSGSTVVEDAEAAEAVDSEGARCNILELP